jgi:hypothetical protein
VRYLKKTAVIRIEGFATLKKQVLTKKFQSNTKESRI